MMKKDIQVGGRYTAKVSGKLTTVRVDVIRERSSYSGDRTQTVYDVTNLATGRRTTFRSAAKFRCAMSTTSAVALAIAALAGYGPT